MAKIIVYFLVVTLAAFLEAQDDVYSFPEGFILGAATASYQIEGGWDEDGKTPSVWDTCCHTTKTELFAESATGDVACDSYHKYKEDVQLLKEIGADFYRFSISWPRILPEGHANTINQPGIDYYNNLIDELLANDIEPVVTMFHWDLPQVLQDLGGWPNEVLADYFEDYARVLYTNFGDRVKWWITFNEPLSFTSAYETASNCPGIAAPGYGRYLSTRTLLLAHARAYHMYDDEFRATQDGRVAITLNIDWCEPKEDTEEYQEICERQQEFELGLFANPIYSEEGDWPAIVKERVDANSEAEGLGSSRLPKFSQEEIEYIRGTYDYYGMNHYTTVYADPYDGTGEPASDSKDQGYTKSSDPDWPTGASSWLHVVPWGIRKELNWISNKYNNPPILITENGYSDNGELNDTARIDYLTSYLSNVLLAVNEDGNNVIGYTAWSLMDNMEWTDGYTKKFGMVQVDFEDPERSRTIKESGKVFAEISETRQIPERYRPSES